MRARDPIDLPDVRAIDLGLHAILRYVAIRTNAYIQFRSIDACNQTLGPMVIDRPRWQVSELSTGRTDLRIAVVIGIADDCIRVCDVQIVSDERHAKRRG